MSSVPTKSRSSSNPITHDYDDVMDALYWAYDNFDWASLRWFIAGNTLKEFINHKIQFSSPIHLGTRETDLTRFTIKTLKQVIPTSGGSQVNVLIKKGGKISKLHFIWNEKVPLVLIPYPRGSYFDNLDSIKIGYERFNIPNPPEKYIQEYL